MKVASAPINISINPLPTGDWIAQYLAANPLAPGKWSDAVDGMGGLNSYHDPNTQASGLASNGASISGKLITTKSPHTMPVGKQVFIRGSSLGGQTAMITAVTASTITIDKTVAAPATVDVRLFPDYFTRSTPFEDEVGGGFLDWNAQFYYDPVTGLHTVGGGVGSAPSYDDAQYKTWRIRYDPRTNKWYKRWNPLGRGGSHHYSSNAMDTVGRFYYRETSAFSLDDDTAAPVVRGGAPADTSVAPAFCFHEHLGRLYRMTGNGRVCHWNAATGWSPHQTFSGLGNHPIASYLSGAKTIVFGGGNSPANKFYKIDPSGVISALDDIPASRMPVSGVATMLLDVGFADRLIVMQDAFESGVNPRPQIGWLEPNAPSGQQWQQSPDVIPAVLASYGGVKRELAACGIRHLGLVMVMRYRASGVLTAANPADRRCAVWFYRPSAA